MKHDRYARFYCDIEKALHDFSPEEIFPDYPKQSFFFETRQDVENAFSLMVDTFLLFYSSVNIARANFKGEKAPVITCMHVMKDID